MLERIKLLYSNQPKLNDCKASLEIKQQLQEYKIKRKLYAIPLDRNNIFVVILENGLLAVFKERNLISCADEIVAYEIAVNFFKLPHTIPPTVRSTYQGMDGVLQYYVPQALDFSQKTSNESYNNDNLKKMEENLSRDSYADFQVFKFVVSLQDVNPEGLAIWENACRQFCITSVDNQFILTCEAKYEEERKKNPFEEAGGIDKRLVDYRYTSFFNSATLENLRNIDKGAFIKLLERFNYAFLPADEIERRANIFFHNRCSLLSYVENRKNHSLYSFFQQLPKFPDNLIRLIAEYDAEQQINLR